MANLVLRAPSKHLMLRICRYYQLFQLVRIQKSEKIGYFLVVIQVQRQRGEIRERRVEIFG